LANGLFTQTTQFGQTTQNLVRRHKIWSDDTKFGQMTQVEGASISVVQHKSGYMTQHVCKQILRRSICALSIQYLYIFYTQHYICSSFEMTIFHFYKLVNYRSKAIPKIDPRRVGYDLAGSGHHETRPDAFGRLTLKFKLLASTEIDQGCQMVNFHTKNANLSKFRRIL
jgi:hypothetical protein